MYVLYKLLNAPRSGQLSGLSVDSEDCEERYDKILERTNDDEKALTAKRSCQSHNIRMSRQSGGGGSLGGFSGTAPFVSAIAGALGRSVAKKFF